MKYFIPFLFFFSCTVEYPPIKIDKIAINQIVDKYIENESLAVLHVYLEKFDGTPLYSNSRQDFSYIGDFVDENTWFRVWSMSKIVTISLALDLIEDGVISMDDDVSLYVPQFKNLKIAKGPNGESLNEWNPDQDLCPIIEDEVEYIMTIRDLFNHKAGFYYSTTSEYCLNDLIASKNLASSTDSDDFIKRLSELPLIQKPGDKFWYGINTTVLGFVLEKATGKSLNELLHERIVDPFNIKGFAYKKEEGVNLMPVFATGEDSKFRLANDGELDIFGKNVPSYEKDNKLYLGGEGMIATTNGYADFLRIILNDGELDGKRLLNKSSIKEMSSPQTQIDNVYGYNGYNLWVTGKKYKEDGKGDEGLWTGGGYEGTHYWIDRKRGFVGLIMTQIFDENGLVDRFRDDIRGEIYKEIFKNEE